MIDLTALYKRTCNVRWSDIDANMHMRNTSYIEFASHARLSCLEEHGFGLDQLKQHEIGPIVFKEEMTYRSELFFGESVTVVIAVAGLSESGCRWRFHHDLYKGNGSLAGSLRTDGAWIALASRSLASPPNLLNNILQGLGRTRDFVQLT